MGQGCGLGDSLVAVMPGMSAFGKDKLKTAFGFLVFTTDALVFLVVGAAGSGPVYGGGAAAGPRGRFLGRPGLAAGLKKLRTSLLSRASESRTCGSVMAIQIQVQTALH